jgi:hypothetical protein
MALLEISNLNPAGSNLFAGEESFLTELQETDTDKVFGGKGGSKKKNSKRSGFGGYPVPFPVPYPVPYYPYPCPPRFPHH